MLHRLLVSSRGGGGLHRSLVSSIPLMQHSRRCGIAMAIDNANGQINNGKGDKNKSSRINIVQENNAKIKLIGENTVFYNKVQELNRDLSVLVINHFAKVKAEEDNAVYQKRLRYYEQSKTVEPEKPAAGISLLEAFCASGIRSIRYLQEIPSIRHLVANDIESTAIENAKSNMELNKLDMSKVTLTQQDSCDLMYAHRQRGKQFDVVDIDPYGNAAPFLDSAIQAVAPGGLLCLTNTDLRALCGENLDACYSRYGAMPLRNVDYSHEMGVRIILQQLDSIAAKYQRAIVPWLCITVDFYIRVYVRVMRSPILARSVSTRKSLVYQASEVPSFYLQPLARVKRRNAVDSNSSNSNKDNIGKEDSNSEQDSTSSSKHAAAPLVDLISAPSAITPTVCLESGAPLKIGGPIWNCALHDKKVVKDLLSYLPVISDSDHHHHQQQQKQQTKLKLGTSTRIVSQLECILNEIDSVFFYEIPSLCSAVNMKTFPRDQFITGLLNMGYQVSAFHRNPGSIKTNAPNNVVWDLLRHFSKISGNTARQLELSSPKEQKDKTIENANGTTMASNNNRDYAKSILSKGNKIHINIYKTKSELPYQSFGHLAHKPPNSSPLRKANPNDTTR